MNTAWRPSLLTGSLCVLAALLAGCSAGSGKGLGKAGKQSAYQPQAVITPIGHVAAADGTLHVRSGAEVLLSAKDSDGRDSAILGFTWSPANTVAEGVRMLERGANAMSFRAPLPPGDDSLELRFRLTIHTADGDSGSSEIRVLVDGVPDPDDFLLTDLSTSADAANIALVAATDLNANSFATDIPFDITVQKRVQYRRAIDTGPNPSANPAANDPVYCQVTASAANTCVKIGAPVHLTGAWLASAGARGTGSVAAIAADVRNPRFRLRPPSLNIDEVNFAVLSGGTTLNGTGVPPTDSRRNNLLYTADIDDAEAEYVITLTPGATLASVNLRAGVYVMAADATQSGQLSYTTGALAANVGEPASITVTASQILSHIKATPGAVESRATAAAYYKTIDPNDQRTTVQDWLRDNCFQPGIAGLPGYQGPDIMHATYLNDRDLGFGRDMYFKTDCEPQHRAAIAVNNVPAPTIDTNAGERASIVFNYPSLEAAIKHTGSFLAVAMEYRADANGVKYTRFYTFAPDPRTGSWKRVTSANFDGRRERFTPGNCTVCHGGKPDYSAGADLGSTFIPWDPQALLFADTDPSIVDTRLTAGYTRAEQLPHIDAMNTLGVRPIVADRSHSAAPNLEATNRYQAALEVLDGWYPTPTTSPGNYDYVPAAWRGQFSTMDSSLSSDELYLKVIGPNCRMCHLQRIVERPVAGAALDRAHAPQLGSFADLQGTSGDTVTERVFQQQLMPASRLTTDRFWLPQGGASKSAAQLLAAHLLGPGTDAVPGVRADGILVDPLQATIDPGAAATVPVRLSGLASRFATGYSWTLQKPAGSVAVLVGANTAEPALLADATGTYTLNLTVQDANGHADALSQPVSFVVDRKPVGGNYAATYPIGQPVSINLTGAGGARLGDGNNTIAIVGAVPAGSGASISGTTLSFTATASGTIHYRITDADGDQADGLVDVTVTIQGQWTIANVTTSLQCALETASANPNQNSCSKDIGVNPYALAKVALGNLSDDQFYQLGYSVTAQFTQQPQQTGRKGTAGSVVLPFSFYSIPGNPNSFIGRITAMTYQSPELFASTSPDSFKFFLRITDSGGGIVKDSSVATVQVTVTPRATWSTVVGYLARTLVNRGCNDSACHQSGPDSATGRGWGALGTPANNYLATYNQLAGTTRTSCPITGDTLDSTKPPYCVDFDNVENSLLLHKPKGELSHSGGAPLNADEIATIENWIRDGAYQN